MRIRLRDTLVCCLGLVLAIVMVMPVQADRASQNIGPQVTDQDDIPGEAGNLLDILFINSEQQPIANAQITAMDASGQDLMIGELAPGKYRVYDVGIKVTVEYLNRGVGLVPFELTIDPNDDVTRVTIALDESNGAVKSIKQVGAILGGGTPNLIPPVNDDCANAIPIFDGSTAFSTIDATTDGPLHASCQFGNNTWADIWYTYVASCDGTLTVSTCSAADYDTDLVMYDGTDCGGLVLLACNDDFSGCSGFTSELSAPVIAGMSYLIRVGGYSSDSDQGTGTLTLTCTGGGGGGGDAGDECEEAGVLPCNGQVTFDASQYSAGANDPAGVSCSGSSLPCTGYFEFVPTETSALIATDINTAGGDSVYALYQVNQADVCDESQWVEFACSEDEGEGLLGNICVNGLTVGDTYILMMTEYGSSCDDVYTVDVFCPCPAPPVGRCCVSGACSDVSEDDCFILGGDWDETLNCDDNPCPQPPPNDLCENAIAVGVPSTTPGSTEEAETDFNAPFCGSASITSPGVWYSVIGTGNTMTASICNGVATWDSKMSVLCQGCAILTCVDGNDDFCGLQSEVTWCSQAGAEYLILVHGFGGATGPFELDVFDDGTPCTGAVACLPVGACCLSGGDCIVVTLEDCDAAMGDYLGDGTFCFINEVADGSFEAGAFGGIWTEFSLNFGTPLCDIGSCGTGTGTGPLSGDWWAWFGGISTYEEGSVSQTVMIPAGVTELLFGLEQIVCDSPADYMEVLIDGNQVFLTDGGSGLCGVFGYAQQTVDISAYADGGMHTLEFHSEIFALNGGGTNFFVDDVVIGTVNPDCVNVIEVDLDIKPGSCPNSFNRGSNGVLPVAVLGTADFDVTTIDLATVVIGRADGVGATSAMAGPPGPGASYEDVGTPYDGMGCDCHEMGGDGFMDLSLKFKTQDVVADLMLGDFSGNEMIELVVSGLLTDGTEFVAYDCIRIVPPNSAPANLSLVPSAAAETWVEVSPADMLIDGGGYNTFDRSFEEGTVVTLTAHDTLDGSVFVGFRSNGVWLTLGPDGRSTTVAIFGDQNVIEAVFETPNSVSQPLGASATVGVRR